MSREPNVMAPQGDGLDAGDILVAAWGHGQTNIDFYRVVRRTETRPGCQWLVLKPMRGIETAGNHGPTGPMCGKKTADVADMGGGPGFRRKVRHVDGKPYGVEISSYKCASPWDGQPEHYSWGN